MSHYQQLGMEAGKRSLFLAAVGQTAMSFDSDSDFRFLRSSNFGAVGCCVCVFVCQNEAVISWPYLYTVKEKLHHNACSSTLSTVPERWVQ